MLLTFQDRLRISWPLFGSGLLFFLPALIVPVVLCIAAINAVTCCLMLLCVGISIGYALRRAQSTQCARTKFFLTWIGWSIAYMLLIFELKLPAYELLPEEHYIFMAFYCAAFFCIFRTWKLAAFNRLAQKSADLLTAEQQQQQDVDSCTSQTALLIEQDTNSLEAQTNNSSNICGICHKYMPVRCVHCKVCGSCIMSYDHHSYWLNCCIGAANHRYYLASLLFAEMALIMGADLVLTAICHPFMIMRLFGIRLLLPDDCSEVFYDYNFSLSFVVAVYALIIAAYILFVLLRQLYFVSIGGSLHDCQRAQLKHRQSIITNWLEFLRRKSGV